MKKYAVIVAGGKGLRMGADLPKQFLPIKGMPVLMRTMQAFYRYDKGMKLILVLPASQMDYWNELCREYDFAIPYFLAKGGKTRFHSVANGLALIPDDEEDALVAVHDGVRPFVSTTVIHSCYEKAVESGAVVPVVEPVETLRELSAKEDGMSSMTVGRSSYRLVQTPQVFRVDLLKRAYAQPYDTRFTDDASVVEALGHPVSLVPGNRENIKITTPFDMKIAEAVLSDAP